MRKSELIYKIKIAIPGKNGVWFNNRIGEIFLAKMAIHPTNDAIKGYLIKGAWFIPASNCELIEGKKAYKKKKNSYYIPTKKVPGWPIHVHDLLNDKHYDFISMKAAARALDIPATPIREALNKEGLYKNFKFTRT